MMTVANQGAPSLPDLPQHGTCGLTGAAVDDAWRYRLPHPGCSSWVAEPSRHPACMVWGAGAYQCFTHLPATGIDDIETGLIAQLPAHLAVKDVCCIEPPNIDSLRQN